MVNLRDIAGNAEEEEEEEEEKKKKLGRKQPRNKTTAAGRSAPLTHCMGTDVLGTSTHRLPWLEHGT